MLTDFIQKAKEHFGITVKNTLPEAVQKARNTGPQGLSTLFNQMLGDQQALFLSIQVETIKSDFGYRDVAYLLKNTRRVVGGEAVRVSNSTVVFRISAKKNDFQEVVLVHIKQHSKVIAPTDRNVRTNRLSKYTTHHEFLIPRNFTKDSVVVSRRLINLSDTVSSESYHAFGGKGSFENCDFEIVIDE